MFNRRTFLTAAASVSTASFVAAPAFGVE